LTFPLARAAAFRQQDNVINGRADRNGAADLEHTHPVALHHPAICISRNRRYVMGQENSPFFSGPPEKRFVIDSTQTGILRTNYIDTWASAA
jgi:hypothetical protein